MTISPIPADRFRRKPVFWVVTLLLHTAVIQGVLGDRQDAPAPVFRITTELVQFDAVVLDRDGQVLTSLAREHFEILQDGRPVVIRDAVFVDRRARADEVRRHPDRALRLGIDVEPLVFLIDDMLLRPTLKTVLCVPFKADNSLADLRQRDRGRRMAT